MELPEVHAQCLLATGGVVAQITEDQLGLPTPCDGWDVADLLNHVVVGNRWVPPLVAGQSIEEVGDRLDGDLLGAAPAQAYNASAHDAAEAFRAVGAMEAMVGVSYGPVPGSVYCGHRVIDVLVHGWDLAVATGQNTDLPAELTAACWEILEPQLDLLAASGAYGHPTAVPADAPTQDKLLAALGRAG